jgi:hypothetical protein
MVPGRACHAASDNMMQKAANVLARAANTYGADRGTGFAISFFASPLSSRSNARCSVARIAPRERVTGTAP